MWERRLYVFCHWGHVGEAFLVKIGLFNFNIPSAKAKYVDEILSHHIVIVFRNGLKIDGCKTCMTSRVMLTARPTSGQALV